MVAEPKEGDEVITFTPLFVTLERYKIISLKDSSILKVSLLRRYEERKVLFEKRFKWSRDG